MESVFWHPRCPLKLDVGDTIGCGSYGVVRVGELDGKIVAIKRCKDCNDTVDSITTERRILKHIGTHPNIIECIRTIHDLKSPKVEERYYYLVLPLMGSNLKQYIRHKFEFQRNWIEDVWDIFLQIAQAVEFCHMKGVIHRDLKPENVLIDPTAKKIKLCDFGMSCKLKHGETHKIREIDEVCTSWYRAPDLFETNKSVPYTNRVDVWSLGCILYEMLFIHPLFMYTKDESDLQSKINDLPAIIKRQVKSLSDITRDYERKRLEGLLLNMLEVDANKRISASDCVISLMN